MRPFIEIDEERDVRGHAPFGPESDVALEAWIGLAPTDLCRDGGLQLRCCAERSIRLLTRPNVRCTEFSKRYP